MKERVISVTVAARMFADCVNRVRYQGASFLLQKNGVSVARLVPVDPVSGMNLEDVVAPAEDGAFPTSDGGKEGLANQTKPNSDSSSKTDVQVQPKPPALNW